MGSGRALAGAPLVPISGAGVPLQWDESKIMNLLGGRCDLRRPTGGFMGDSTIVA